MAVQSYQEQLEQVQAAIKAIEAGAQSYSIAGRAVQRADLQKLYEREKYLKTMIAREELGGISVWKGYT